MGWFSPCDFPAYLLGCPLPPWPPCPAGATAVPLTLASLKRASLILKKTKMHQIASPPTGHSSGFSLHVNCIPGILLLADKTQPSWPLRFVWFPTPSSSLPPLGSSSGESSTSLGAQLLCVHIVPDGLSASPPTPFPRHPVLRASIEIWLICLLPNQKWSPRHLSWSHYRVVLPEVILSCFPVGLY